MDRLIKLGSIFKLSYSVYYDWQDLLCENQRSPEELSIRDVGFLNVKGHLSSPFLGCALSLVQEMFFMEMNNI